MKANLINTSKYNDLGSSREANNKKVNILFSANKDVYIAFTFMLLLLFLIHSLSSHCYYIFGMKLIFRGMAQLVGINIFNLVRIILT